MEKIGRYTIRLATDSDTPRVRKLVNEAYKELADLGLNYTATYQDEEITRQRMGQGRCFLLFDDKVAVGTILLFDKDYLKRGKRSAYVGQFGIHPDYKRMGLGNLLMNYVEGLAIQEGYEAIQLDTAKTASHLVNWYLKREYQIIADEHWEGKTYQSWIFEKQIGP